MRDTWKPTLIISAIGLAIGVVLATQSLRSDLGLQIKGTRSSPGELFVVHATLKHGGTGATRDGVRPGFRDSHGRDLGLSLVDIVMSAGLAPALGETCDHGPVDRATLERRAGRSLESQAAELDSAIDSGRGLLLEYDYQRIQDYMMSAARGEARPLLACGGRVAFGATDGWEETVRATTLLRVLPQTPRGEYQLIIPSVFYDGIAPQMETRWTVWIE